MVLKIACRDFEKILLNITITALNFTPLWKGMWHHHLFYVRRGWNVCTVFSSHENTPASIMTQLKCWLAYKRDALWSHVHFWSGIKFSWHAKHWTSSLGRKNLLCVFGPWTCLRQNLLCNKYVFLKNACSEAKSTYEVFPAQRRHSKLINYLVLVLVLLASLVAAAAAVEGHQAFVVRAQGLLEGLDLSFDLQQVPVVVALLLVCAAGSEIISEICYNLTKWVISEVNIRNKWKQCYTEPKFVTFISRRLTGQFAVV